MQTDTQNNDAVRELLCKRVADLEARNAALTDQLDSFCHMCNIWTGIKPDWDVYELIQKEHHGAVAEAWRQSRILLAANAPAPAVEREPIGSLK